MAQIDFISGVIRDFKKRYPTSVTIVSLFGSDVDLDTGQIINNTATKDIKAVRLPESDLFKYKFRESDLAMLSVVLLIDSSDLIEPLQKSDKITIGDATYDILKIIDHNGKASEVLLSDVKGS